MSARPPLGRSATDPEAEAPLVSPRDLAEWITQWIALRLGVEPRAIDPCAPFTDHGLDSMAAVALSGDLEQRLGRPVSPSLAWEYPTIVEVADHLALSSDASSGLGGAGAGE